jgi:hypothetical protein
MKNVNRKVLLSLLGIATATPFLVIGLAVGVRATALANSLQGELLLVALVLGSAVASIVEGRIALRGETATTSRGRLETKGHAKLHGASTFNPGY